MFIKYSFISWVNNNKLYQQFLDSAKFINNAEFIKIPSNEQFNSMAKAYNEGTKRAIGEILIYVHQDVQILDTRFEQIVSEICRINNLGFAGVAGNVQESERCWWESTQKTSMVGVSPNVYNRGWVIQNNPQSGIDEDQILFFKHYKGPAKQLDGLILITDKKFNFPEEELPGYHFLDLWMCKEAQVHNYQNYIIPLVVKHFSYGELQSKEFEQNYQIYKERWFHK